MRELVETYGAAGQTERVIFENRLERKWTNEMHPLRRKAYLQTSLNVTRVIFQLRKMSFISVRARSMPKYFNHEALFSGKHKENPFHKTKNPQVGAGHKACYYIDNSLYIDVCLGQLEYCVSFLSHFYGWRR